MTTTQLHLSPELVGTLNEGRQAYIAVPSKDGPHVTPELFAWTADRLWFASASTTLKSKVLAADGRAGVVVSAGGRDVLLTGGVTRFDIRQPWALARLSPNFPRRRPLGWPTSSAMHPTCWPSWPTRRGADSVPASHPCASSSLWSRTRSRCWRTM